MFKKSRPFSKLMITALIVVVSTIVFSLLGMLVIKMTYNVNLFAVNGDGTTTLLEDNINALKVLQIFQSIGLFIVPTLISVPLFFDNGLEALSLNRSIPLKNVIYVLLLMVIITPFVSLLGALNEQMTFPDFLSKLEEMMRSAEESAMQLTEKFLKVDNFNDLLINIFMIAVIPAIGEELFFRGLLLRIFRGMTSNIHVAIIITGIVFSFFHFQFYGFLPRALLGILFGYLLIWSGSLWLPILAHFLNNGFATVGYYLIEKKVVSPDIDQYSLDMQGLIIGLVSALLSAFIIWTLWKINIVEFKKDIHSSC